MGKYRITAAGEREASRQLGRKGPPGGSQGFRSICSFELPALATGLLVQQADAAFRIAFSKLLPLWICVRKHELAVPLDRGITVAYLELVKLALSKASDVQANRLHLKKLPGGMLPALVVGPLLGTPDTPSENLESLLSAVARGIVEKPNLSQIKPWVVQRWLCDNGDAALTTTSAAGPPPPVVQQPSLSAAPTASEVDLATFSLQALTAANTVARDGGPGVSSTGDKVLVYSVWRQYERMFGPLMLEQFKQNLSDANGEHLVLVREDLIPVNRFEDYTKSEVRTGLSSFHYIRVKNVGEHHAGT